ARGALVRGDLRAEELRARLGAHVDDAAVLEAELAALDDGPVPVERSGEPDGSFRAAAIGGREHLLGRQVRHVSLAPRGRRLRGLPDRGAEESDLELGAGAREADDVEV